MLKSTRYYIRQVMPAPGHSRLFPLQAWNDADYLSVAATLAGAESVVLLPVYISGGITSEASRETAQQVIDKVREAWPDHSYELVRITTKTETVDESTPEPVDNPIIEAVEASNRSQAFKRLQAEHANIKTDYYRIVNNLFEMRDMLRDQVDQSTRDRDETQERIDNFNITGGTPRELEGMKRYYSGMVNASHVALNLLNAVDFANYREKDEKDQKPAA